MKKLYTFITLILCCLLLTSTMIGCGKDEGKVFTKEGMSITLTKDFHEKEYISYTAYYESNNALVIVIKEPLKDFPSSYRNYNETEYAELVCSQNNLADIEVSTKEGYAEFSYEKNVSAKDFHYYARCFKTEDAFWTIQFACLSSQKDKLNNNIQKWANSITFATEE